MEIFLGSDHAGFELKEKVQKFLQSKDYVVTDCGPEVFDPMDDYPDFISRVAENVATNTEARGIIIGMSGQGEAMVANRFHNVRAAVYYGGPLEIVSLSREHNDSNVLSFGSKFLNEAQVMQVIELWLGTPFSGEDRHIRRIGKIEQYD
jgi:ribose 5-phosphate isomerase B